jgi:hypothetical protein
MQGHVSVWLTHNQSRQKNNAKRERGPQFVIKWRGGEHERQPVLEAGGSALCTVHCALGLNSVHDL